MVKLKICKLKSLELGGYFDLKGAAKEIINLEKEISRPDFWQQKKSAAAINKRYQDLKANLDSWKNLKSEIDDLLTLSKIAGADKKLEKEIKKKLSQAENEFSRLDFLMLFSGPHDRQDALISIHAGAGGVDAQDWAEILLRMYLRFCERHNFQTKIIEKSEGSEAGLKRVVLEVNALYAYGWLKSENGVHRLVRISPFDAEKMRHTSFALVEVLPELDWDQTIELKDEDLKIDVMRASGHGGQSVNTTDSAVRITHLPTKIVVRCQNERSQHQNRINALKILKAKLLKYHEERASDQLQKLKGEYQQAEWGNQARSYVMQPYKLVKDHRTNFEIKDIDRVLNGDLDDFVRSYLQQQIKSK